VTGPCRRPGGNAARSRRRLKTRSRPSCQPQVSEEALGHALFTDLLAVDGPKELTGSLARPPPEIRLGGGSPRFGGPQSGERHPQPRDSSEFRGTESPSPVGNWQVAALSFSKFLRASTMCRSDTASRTQYTAYAPCNRPTPKLSTVDTLSLTSARLFARVWGQAGREIHTSHRLRGSPNVVRQPLDVRAELLHRGGHRRRTSRQ
jgi:hypothetical protein